MKLIIFRALHQKWLTTKRPLEYRNLLPIILALVRIETRANFLSNGGERLKILKTD